MDPAATDPRLTIRKLRLIGYIAIVLLIGGAGTWSAVARIKGAVIAPGTLVVKSNVKKVQHLSGGVVKEILVAEGDYVKEGQILMRLDDTVTKATLGMVQSQLDELIAREARLESERDDADRIVFPAELKARAKFAAVTGAMTGEEKLFESRRRARVGQVSQLQARITQTNEEIRGLDAQKVAKEKEIGFIGEELIGVRDLYKKNLVSISRLVQLQRDEARLEGERGQMIAEAARARGRINEFELQILQVDRDYRSEVLKDMRETQGKIAELRERFIAAEDQLVHTDIRATQTGYVYQLAVHTVGGVIAAGSTIMEIVPRADELLVESKIPPQDIDQIALDSTATVEINAGDRRMMPELIGKVTYISPDSIRDQAQAGQQTAPYYLIRVSIPKSEIERLGNFRLVPGMPAEAFVQTYARTPIAYILKPLREQIARTFRER